MQHAPPRSNHTRTHARARAQSPHILTHLPFPSDEGRIGPLSRWRDYCTAVEADPTYAELLKNKTGSKPKELFQVGRHIFFLSNRWGKRSIRSAAHQLLKNTTKELLQVGLAMFSF